MALFLLTRGIKTADVLKLAARHVLPRPRSSTCSPAAWGSRRAAGQSRFRRSCWAERKPLRGRPGARLPAIDLEKELEALRDKHRKDATEADLYCHLMYPEVYAEFVRFHRTYEEVTMLPTGAFLYGLRPGEEISIEIEPGKILFVKLIHVGEPDKDGYRTVLFELNGRPRETFVLDHSIQTGPSRGRRRIRPTRARSAPRSRGSFPPLPSPSAPGSPAATSC